MGHGVKDCEECREIDEPVVSYGTWLKASPWKYNAAYKRDEGGKKGESCARPLFITKPKQPTIKCTSSTPIHEVVDRLVGVELNNDGGVNNTVQSNFGEIFTFNNGENNDLMLEKPVVENENSSAKQTHGRGWKRNPRDGDRSMGYDVKLVGEKRRERDEGADKNDLLAVEGNARSKKRSAVSNTSQVASPTQWALVRSKVDVLSIVMKAEILRDAVQFCQLNDMGYIGHDYTWTNNRGGSENVQERLDRFFANQALKDTFPGTFVTHLSKRRSDHLPILLCVKEAVNTPKKKKKKVRLYRFEEMWLRDENCVNIVTKAWERGVDICSKIAFTSANLSAWSREKFEDFVRELKDYRAKMESLMSEAQSDEVIAQMRALDDRMDELERHEELYWKQRSHQEWLKNYVTLVMKCVSTASFD
uniref:Uncharacterized protein n=1 Tax=Chenopodium quinoa TaxID=63459 RepID=A0A803MKM3_CHEQI